MSEKLEDECNNYIQIFNKENKYNKKNKRIEMHKAFNRFLR
jgi:hypothetical protein